MSNKNTSCNQSFANLNYDTCSLAKKENENKHHFEWTTDINYGKSKSECFVGLSPFSHRPNKSISNNLVDIESELFGQTRPLSKCPSVQYSPLKTVKRKIPKLKNCNNFLDPSYTRVKKSCNIFSGININRFDPLCEDFQSMNKIQENCYIGANTRLNVQDACAQNYKTPVNMSKVKTINQCNKVPYDEKCRFYN
jgi:hypothetical protein